MHVRTVDLLTYAQWEKAKGELRALVEMHGAVSSGVPIEETTWYKLKEEVEAFIKAIEDDEAYMVAN